MGTNMKFVLVLPVSEAAGSAAAGSRALAAEFAKYAVSQVRSRMLEQPLPHGRGSDQSRDRQGAVFRYVTVIPNTSTKVKELAQEEHPAPLIKTPGRPEK
jgi:hypothetical protein